MFQLEQGIVILCEACYVKAGEKLKEYLQLFYGIEANIETEGIRLSKSICIVKGQLEPEHYAITIEDETAMITAGEIKGAIYGIAAFLQMIDIRSLAVENVSAHDKPYKKVRGIHMYLPARKNIETYKRILDVLVFFKVNTVIIEVGGAMEYETHPEINETWEWFCDLADNKFPGEGKSRSIQWSDIYWKDSIHTEHAGGSYLTKEEVSDIVTYAKSFGLEVIPEIQALSHSYYLTLAHREIAELQDDIFPDSFCPLNEKSYELYFDIAKEVIEVFEPRRVSIGHDEIRVLGQCEKCRKKTGHELLSYEINRLHEFYSKHNIKIMMWGEMLQHYYNYKGVLMGEAVDTINEYGFRYTLPATYNAKHSIPKDILMLDWQYSLSYDSELHFIEDGFQVLFGNFAGSRMLDWKKRSMNDNMIGAEVSTWVSADERTYARDGIFFEIMFSTYMLWNKDYDLDQYENTVHDIINKMYFTRAIMRGEASILQSGGKSKIIYLGNREMSCVAIDLINATAPCKLVEDAIRKLGTVLYGTPIDTVNILIKDTFFADSLLFLHSAKKDMEYKPSHIFPEESLYGLGTYAILYEDGLLEFSNIIYGRNIGNIEFEIKKGDGYEESVSYEIDTFTGNKEKNIKAPTFSPGCQWNDSILYETVPVTDGHVSVFAYEWRNPYPDKRIVKIKAINTCRDRQQYAILFGILAVKK